MAVDMLVLAGTLAGRGPIEKQKNSDGMAKGVSTHCPHAAFDETERGSANCSSFAKQEALRSTHYATWHLEMLRVTDPRSGDSVRIRPMANAVSNSL
jgi:hypothetical protein